MSQLPRSAGLWPKYVNFLVLVVVVLIALPIFSGVAAATELTVSPTSENFGTVTIGTSISETITLTNESISTIKVSNVPIWGTGFSLKGITTPLILSAHQVFTFQVVYDPPSGTASSGGMIVISNAADSPQRLTLSGTGWVPVNAVVPDTFFGLALHPEVLNDRVPWPTFPFGAMRLWDTETQWSLLNPSEGTYNFAELDTWF